MKPEHSALLALGAALAIVTAAPLANAQTTTLEASSVGRISALPVAQNALKFPAAVRVAQNGDHYVLDSGNGRVVVLGSDGSVKALRNVGSPSRSQFEGLTDLALDNQGNFYVTDAVANVVEKFSPDGRKVMTIGVPGQLNGPQALTVTDRDEVIVSDTMAHTVAVFDPSGHLARKFGKEGMANGEFRFPHGIAVDRNGNIYVADFLNSRIQVFAPSGVFARTWGSKGEKAGQFQTPHGLAIDARQRLWVTDSNFNRVQSFNLDGSNPQILVPPAGGLEQGFDHPKGIAVAPNGQILVANVGKHAIEVLRPSNP
jgi:DNA-binding beta-propeller fold protein YncE